MKSIAVLLPNWVGDVVMASLAVRSLRERFPEAEILGVVKPHLIEILSADPWIDEFLPSNHQNWSGPNGFWATAASLRRRKLSGCVNLRSSLRARMLAGLSGARKIVNLSKRKGVSLPSEIGKLQSPTQREKPQSTTDSYLETVARLGCDTSDRSLSLSTTFSDELAANQVWTQLNLPANGRVVMFNAGSAGSPARHWPVDHFASLGRRMIDEWGASVLVHCGPQERELGRQIASAIDRQQATSLADVASVPLGMIKSLLRRVRLLVTTDSGPRHLAAAMGTPVVLLAGPIDPLANHNYHLQEIAVQNPLDCMPCNKSRCPLLHQRCLRELSVAKVLEAAKGLWEEGAFEPEDLEIPPRGVERLFRRVPLRAA